MKFYSSYSEAIREGAKLRPQIHGMFVSKNGSCALSAGAEAILGEPCRGAQIEKVTSLSEYAYMADRLKTAACPSCDTDFSESLRDVVIHLNDHHKWSREAIADWLEKEEEKLGFVTISEPEERSSSPELVAVGV